MFLDQLQLGARICLSLGEGAAAQVDVSAVS